MRIAVVGRGLIGAAAARHLARAGHDVALIGPSEPLDLATHRGVFASHYDEGRITRALDGDPFWSRVSRASIARYAEIEREGGVRFFAEAGAAISGPEGAEAIGRVAAVRRAEAIASDELRGEALAARFPFFAFAPGTLAYHEPRGAGHVSPRRLVEAQTRAARRAGARVVEAVATGVSERGGGVVVRTGAGDVEADRALLAAGGFTPSLAALPVPLAVYARTVALLEVDEAEGRRLAAMPTLIHYDGRDPYLLPPIRYPDGRLRLKMGGDPEDVVLEDDRAKRAWFRSGGSPRVAVRLEAMMRERIPGLRTRARRLAPCVTTFTPSDRPLIEPLTDRVAVATAGCGRGAKCSDELGRMGAALVAPLRAPVAP